MYRIVFLSFLVVWGCKAKQNNEGIPEAPAAGIPVLEQTADSVGNVQQDGTATTTQAPLEVKQQLPAALEVNLDRLHGPWQYPILSEADKKRVPENEQGPYYLEPDFNSDGKPDFAVQIVKQDSAYILAFVSQRNENVWKEQLLEKHALQTLEGKKRSQHYLTVSPKAKKSHATSGEGIIVGNEKTRTIYVYDGGGFKKSKAVD